MFILRKITKDNSEMNFALGENYTLVLKEISPERFQKYYIEVDSIPDSETYGYIVYDSGKIIELYNTQKNYIMTDGGNTFSNISYR